MLSSAILAHLLLTGNDDYARAAQEEPSCMINVLGMLLGSRNVRRMERLCRVGTGIVKLGMECYNAV